MNILEENQRAPKGISQQQQSDQITYSDCMLADNIPSFLLKTYEILENPKFEDIISWTRNGEGFVVKKVKEFADQILPVYFRHNNYTSFVRQLNMYDFHKTRQENQENAFKNFMFKKGHKHLLKEITRKDYKKNKQNNKEMYSLLERPKSITDMNFSSGLTSDKYFLKRNESHDFSAGYKSSLNGQKDNLSEAIRKNVFELEKTKFDLEEGSLMLMAAQEWETSSEALMKAIDILFECGMSIKREHLQVEKLKTDIEIVKRRDHFCEAQKTSRGDQEDSLLKTGQKYSAKESKEPATTDSKPDNKFVISGFEKYDPTLTTLFNSFRSD